MTESSAPFASAAGIPSSNEAAATEIKDAENILESAPAPAPEAADSDELVDPAEVQQDTAEPEQTPDQVV